MELHDYVAEEREIAARWLDAQIQHQERDAAMQWAAQAAVDECLRLRAALRQAERALRLGREALEELCETIAGTGGEAYVAMGVALEVVEGTLERE